MDDPFAQMREYIMVTEHLLQAEFDNDAVTEITEELTPVSPTVVLLEELSDLVFKLRAFTESADGDLGFGVEMGMQRAADMIENLINRNSENDDG
jgi:hypothetical protein